MKLKQIIAVLTIATILVGLWVKFSADKLEKEEITTQDKKNINPIKKEIKPIIADKTQEKLKIFESRFPKQTPPSWPEKPWQIYKYSLKRSWLDINDIDYYCIVLNQFQEPVEAAEVVFSVSQISEDVSKMLETKIVCPRIKKEVKINSNGQGISHLTGERGDRLKLTNITKVGYSYIPANESYSFEKGLRRPESSLDEPDKVYLIDETLCEPLYKRGSYKNTMYGKSWDVDILRRNKKGPTPEQVNLRISCKQLKEYYKSSAWEVTIDPPVGVEISLASKHSYLAKNLSTNKIIVKNEEIDYRGHLYIFFHDKTEDFYSKIKVEVSGHRDDARISFISFSNPIKGSKNLTYLKEKRLRDWPGVISPQK